MVLHKQTFMLHCFNDDEELFWVDIGTDEQPFW